MGHLAARRAKEKASERGRRMALDKAPQAKVSASPDVHKVSLQLKDSIDLTCGN